MHRSGTGAQFFPRFWKWVFFLSNFSTSLPIWIAWIFYHNITSSKTPKLKSFHHHLSFTLFLPVAKGIKSTTRAAALFHQPAFSMLECVQNINQGRGAAVPPPQIKSTEVRLWCSLRALSVAWTCAVLFSHLANPESQSYLQRKRLLIELRVFGGGFYTERIPPFYIQLMLYNTEQCCMKFFFNNAVRGWNCISEEQIEITSLK